MVNAEVKVRVLHGLQSLPHEQHEMVALLPWRRSWLWHVIFTVGYAQVWNLNVIE